MYGIDLSVQFENLMPALGLGFILGFLYDIVRLLRLICSKGKTFLFVTDMLFVIMSAVTSYLLYIAVNNGHIRVYLVAAQILGATVYRFTAGELIFSFFEKITLAVKKIIKTVFAPFLIFGRRVLGIMRKTIAKSGKILKKIQNKFKKPLKDDNDLLYNNND